jgi:hypothetical protein
MPALFELQQKILTCTTPGTYDNLADGMRSGIQALKPVNALLYKCEEEKYNLHLSKAKKCKVK